MRVAAGNWAAAHCCNTANSSLTIGVKKENLPVVFKILYRLTKYRSNIKTIQITRKMIPLY